MVAVDQVDASCTQVGKVARPGWLPRVGGIDPWEDDHRRAGDVLAQNGEGLIVGDAERDVDLVDGTVRVRRTVQRLRGQGLVFGPPKSPRSRRTIPLPESSLKILLAHRDRQDVERLAAGARWQESGLVFTTTVGTVIEPRNLSRTFDGTSQLSVVSR